MQCVSRGKKTLKTDLQRYETWIKPDFASQPVPEITLTYANKLVVKRQEAGRAAATIRNAGVCRRRAPKPLTDIKHNPARV